MQAGMRILQQGGTAADAAVAIAAALNVTEPCSTGIGGDAFALWYDAKTKKVTGLMANGHSPRGLTMEVRSPRSKNKSIALAVFMLFICKAFSMSACAALPLLLCI